MAENGSALMMARSSQKWTFGWVRSCGGFLAAGNM
jgi:hypothetical protein